MKSILFYVAVFFFIPIATAQSFNENIYFQTAKFHLSQESKTKLDTLVNQLKAAENYTIEIIGHTDAVGSDAYNDQLSQNRIQAAVDYLNKQGIDASLGKLVPSGEKIPVASNKNELGRKQNRRVEIRVVLTPKSAADNINTLYKMLATRPQEFCINPKRDTVLIGQDGGKLFFPANSFVLPESCKDGCVTIRIRESYKKSEMLLDNLATRSNGAILESGGMIETRAYDCKDQELSLRQGAEFTTFIPATFPIENPELFEGERGHDSSMNWLRASLPINQVNFIQGAGCDYLYNTKGITEDVPTCDRCKFFCRLGRIDEGLAGMRSRDVKATNKVFRNCQRTLRKNRRRGIKQPTQITRWVNQSTAQNCNNLDSLMKAFGVKNYKDLLLALNKEKLDFYKVKTLEELQDTLAKIYRIEADSIRKAQDLERERRVKSGEATAQEGNYYLFQNKGMGWRNVDCFSNYPKNTLTTVSFSEKAGQTNVDVKVAFIKVRSMIGANTSVGDNLGLMGVPKNQDVWIIGLKILDKQPYFYLEKTSIKPNEEYTIDFKKMTVEEIQQAIKAIDGI